MEIVARDDLRKRVPPRLYDFHAWYRRSDRQVDEFRNGDEGVVSWHKFNYQKDYCQSLFGYTCQRPATSVYGFDGTGKNKCRIRSYYMYKTLERIRYGYA